MQAHADTQISGGDTQLADGLEDTGLEDKGAAGLEVNGSDGVAVKDPGCAGDKDDGHFGVYEKRTYLPVPIEWSQHADLVKKLDNLPNSEWCTKAGVKATTFGMANSKVSPGPFLTSRTLRYPEIVDGLTRCAMTWSESYGDTDFKWSSALITKDPPPQSEHVVPGCLGAALFSCLGCVSGGNMHFKDPDGMYELDIPALGHVFLANSQHKHKVKEYEILDGHMYVIALFTRNDSLSFTRDDLVKMALLKQGMLPFGHLTALKCCFHKLQHHP